MEQWEYKVVRYYDHPNKEKEKYSAKFERINNTLGLEGWKLVSVASYVLGDAQDISTYFYAFFKRKKV